MSSRNLAAIEFQTAKERTFADLQYGTTFSAVVKMVSVAGLQSEVDKYQIRYDSGDCHEMFTFKVGHESRHIVRTRVATALAAMVPLVLNDFDSYWWIVHPPRAPAAAPTVRSIYLELA